MRKHYVPSAALLVGALSLFSMAFASSSRGTSLSEAAMANLRGGSAQLGKCTATCKQYQALSGQAGTWSCVGKPDGTLCDDCESGISSVTYPDQTTGDKDPCPGSFFTRGNPQSCGKKSNAFSATCQNDICTGATWSLTDCAQPKEAVKQPGH